MLQRNSQFPVYQSHERPGLPAEGALFRSLQKLQVRAQRRMIGQELSERPIGPGDRGLFCGEAARKNIIDLRLVHLAAVIVPGGGEIRRLVRQANFRVGEESGDRAAVGRGVHIAAKDNGQIVAREVFAHAAHDGLHAQHARLVGNMIEMGVIVMEALVRLERAQHHVRAYARAARLIRVARAGHVRRRRKPEGFQRKQLEPVAPNGDHVVFAVVMRAARAADEQIIRQVALEKGRHLRLRFLEAGEVGFFRVEFIQHEPLAKLPAVFSVVRRIAAEVKSHDFHFSFSLCFGICYLQL